MSASIEIFAVTREEHLEEIRQLAGEIWHEHYPGIITVGQIDYMLDQQYSLDSLRTNFRRGRVHYDRALFDNETVGFSAYEPLEQSNELKLQSLYVRSDKRRFGCGRSLLDRVVKHAAENEFAKVILTVNRKNTSAIDAYHRFGFTIRGSLVTDIGGGYVMDDHFMELDLSAA